MDRYLAGLTKQPIFYIKIRVTFMSPGGGAFRYAQRQAIYTHYPYYI